MQNGKPFSQIRYYVRAKDDVDEKHFQELGAEHVVPLLKENGTYVLSFPTKRVLRNCAKLCLEGPEQEIGFHITLIDMLDKEPLAPSGTLELNQDHTEETSSTVRTRASLRNNQERLGTDKPKKRGRKLS